MITVHRILTQVEDIHHEFGPPAAKALRRGAIAAVLHNPFAGRYEPHILPMMDALQPMGIRLAQQLLAALAVPAAQIESYGKGAIIGAAGELEHGALWHVPGGYAMRELLGWKGDRNAYSQGQGDQTRKEPHESSHAEAPVAVRHNGDRQADRKQNVATVTEATGHRRQVRDSRWSRSEKRIGRDDENRG